jgi:hypothetical protein
VWWHHSFKWVDIIRVHRACFKMKDGFKKKKRVLMEGGDRESAADIERT